MTTQPHSRKRVCYYYDSKFDLSLISFRGVLLEFWGFACAISTFGVFFLGLGALKIAFLCTT